MRLRAEGHAGDRDRNHGNMRVELDRSTTFPFTRRNEYGPVLVQLRSDVLPGDIVS